MAIVRVKLLKSGYRNNLKEVNEMVADLQRRCREANYTLEITDVVLDTNSSQYSIEVTAERRGQLGSELGLLNLRDAQNGQKSSCALISSTPSNLQL